MAAPSLNCCAAASVGWFGAEGAEEPGVTVDGGLDVVLLLLPLITSAAMEPGAWRVRDI